MHAKTWDRVVRADVVQEGDAATSLHLVNELALPEQHWVLLVFSCFFLKN